MFAYDKGEESLRKETSHCMLTQAQHVFSFFLPPSFVMFD